MTKAKIWFLAITAALGGFLFGFDTIVINGAEQDIQKLWNLSGQMHGWVVSAALWGTVLGSIAGGKVSDRFGRKNTLFGVGILFFVSAVWSAFAAGPWSMIAARFIGGLGVGVSTIAAPVYIAEISPAESRGRLTALFQFNIVLGVVVSLASNLALKDVGENAWRWMLGVEAFPALVFTALCPFLVESPRWLASRGKDAAEESSAPFFCRANLRPILLAFCVAFFNQLSGCNAVNYFAPRIFNLAGFERNAQFLATFGLGLLNFAATFTGVWLIDRLGRKTLLLVGGAGYVVSLGRRQRHAGRRVHLPLHGRARRRTGHRHLGADRGGVPTEVPRAGTGPRQFHALVLRRARGADVPDGGGKRSGVGDLRILRRDDGGALPLGAVHRPRNQGSPPRGHSALSET